MLSAIIIIIVPTLTVMGYVHVDTCFVYFNLAIVHSLLVFCHQKQNRVIQLGLSKPYWNKHKQCRNGWTLL